MRATVLPAATVRTLVAAIADDRIRDLLITLLLNGLAPPPARRHGPPHKAAAPDKPRRGRPPGQSAQAATGTNGPARQSGRRKPGPKPKYKSAAELAARKAKRTAQRRHQRHAAKAANAANAATAPYGKNANGNGGDNQPPPAISAQALWAQARKLEPQAPWKAVCREFGLPEYAARRSFDINSMPKGLQPMALTRFLELSIPA
jgi:hypothetical protein